MVTSDFLTGSRNMAVTRMRIEKLCHLALTCRRIAKILLLYRKSEIGVGEHEGDVRFLTDTRNIGVSRIRNEKYALWPFVMAESPKFSANTNTLKTVLKLKNNYQVDFSIDNSLRTVLGFNEGTYTSNYQQSENIVNIVNVNSILVNIDIITGSYVNGSVQPTIYSFFLDMSPGFKVIEKPAHTKISTRDVRYHYKSSNILD